MSGLANFTNSEELVTDSISIRIRKTEVILKTIASCGSDEIFISLSECDYIEQKSHVILPY